MRFLVCGVAKNPVFGEKKTGCSLGRVMGMNRG